MINKSTFLTALGFAKELEAQGKYVTTSGSTLIGDLVEDSCRFDGEVQKNTLLPALTQKPTYTFEVTAEEEAEALLSRTTSGDGMSQHTLRVEALADDIGKYVMNHLHFTRNVVVPRVVELAEKLEKFAEVARPLDPASTFEIVEGEVPEFILDASFLGDLEPYKTARMPDPVMIGTSFPVPEGGYLELVTTSSDRINKMIQKWLTRTRKDGIDLLEKIHQANFGVSDTKYNIGFISKYNRNPYDILEAASIVFLMAQYYLKNPQEVRYNNLKAALRDLQDYAGISAWKALETINRQISTGIVVAEANTALKKVVVHQSLYRSWLEEDGCPEVLMGMVASGKIVYSVSGLRDAQARCLESWRLYVKVSEADGIAELKKRFKLYLEAEVHQSLKDLSDVEQEFKKENPQFLDEAAKRIKAEIEHLAHRLLDNPYHTALHVVAKGRFYFTNSYFILQTMEELGGNSEENLNAQEVEVLAKIEYLADYAAAQLMLVK